jgi:hypothetical protein
VARRRVVHVATSRRLRRVKAKIGQVDATGCVGPFYSEITVLSVLGPMSDVVF